MVRALTLETGVTAVKPRKARAPKILQEAAPLPAASTSTTPTQEELSERSDVPREELDGSEGEAEAQELGSISPSPLEAQLRRDLARYPQAILLTQVGSFFEVSSALSKRQADLRAHALLSVVLRPSA
jgi:hypothetical protein